MVSSLGPKVDLGSQGHERSRDRRYELGAGVGADSDGWLRADLGWRWDAFEVRR